MEQDFISFVRFSMSKTELIELIDSLTLEEQEQVVEFATSIHSIDERPLHWTDELEAQYRQYIIEGIAEGEEAIREGRVHTTEEVRAIFVNRA